MRHPNAAVALGAGGAAAALVSTLGAFGVPLPEEAAVSIVAVLPAVALFIGRRGIKGLASLVWQGEPELPDE